MVGVFVRLKLRLLRRVTRSGVIGIVLFVLMWLLAAVVGLGAGSGQALVGSAADPVLMTSLVFTSSSLSGW